MNEPINSPSKIFQAVLLGGSADGVRVNIPGHVTRYDLVVRKTATVSISDAAVPYVDEKQSYVLFDMSPAVKLTVFAHEDLTPEDVMTLLLERYAPFKEPPLLSCIGCKNTESPAGAMARAFNQGRCMHCGNYFKVVRG